jgi:nucleotide-binding universal stress UspA family protein
VAPYRGADGLLARIEALEPALVVIGAFGRRSWRERVFGAVTHHLVDRVEAPLLLSS